MRALMTGNKLRIQLKSIEVTETLVRGGPKTALVSFAITDWEPPHESEGGVGHPVEIVELLEQIDVGAREQGVDLNRCARDAANELIERLKGLIGNLTEASQFLSVNSQLVEWA